MSDTYKYIILMKIGYHSDENLDDIIKRKLEEDKHGPFFWGYGGMVCHPVNQVQPFAEFTVERKTKLYLLMALTPSKFITNPDVLTQYSADRIVWENVPSYAHITGSKYALVCKNLQKISMSINLNDYIVGVGPKKNVGMGDEGMGDGY